MVVVVTGGNIDARVLARLLAAAALRTRRGRPTAGSPRRAGGAGPAWPRPAWAAALGAARGGRGAAASLGLAVGRACCPARSRPRAPSAGARCSPRPSPSLAADPRGALRPLRAPARRPARAASRTTCALFLAEKRITGVGGRGHRRAAAAGGRLRGHADAGWPDYEWDQLAEVLLYPQDFDRDYCFESDELSGQAHRWGTVILSVPALQESFDDPDDGYHVGLHEFAHLLDVDQTRFDGVPPASTPPGAASGCDVVEHGDGPAAARQVRARPLRRGEPGRVPGRGGGGLLRAARSPCASGHREVYAMLRDYFGQDPAAWDEARGLE